MNEPHLTYPLAKPADGYVKLIHGSVDIKVIDAVFAPTHRISAHPEPLEHVGGQGYRVDPVGGDVRHLAGDPVGMGVDPLGEYAGHGNYFPGAQNERRAVEAADRDGSARGEGEHGMGYM